MVEASPTTTHNNSQDSNSATHEGYMRAAEVACFLSIGINTWLRWVKEETAPKGHKLSEGVTVWKRSDIHTFVENRAAI